MFDAAASGLVRRATVRRFLAMPPPPYIDLSSRFRTLEKLAMCIQGRRQWQTGVGTHVLRMQYKYV